MNACYDFDWFVNVPENNDETIHVQIQNFNEFRSRGNGILLKKEKEKKIV